MSSLWSLDVSSSCNCWCWWGINRKGLCDVSQWIGLARGCHQQWHTVTDRIGLDKSSGERVGIITGKSRESCGSCIRLVAMNVANLDWQLSKRLSSSSSSCWKWLLLPGGCFAASQAVQKSACAARCQVVFLHLAACSVLARWLCRYLA